MSHQPFRFNNTFTVSVPTTDWRTHPETDCGDHYIYGSGVVHHDLVNVPFYGVMYDTAVVAHPLSNSECLADPRVKVSHIQHVLAQLRDIQMQSRLSAKCTEAEFRARQDSIETLKRLRESALERLWDRYYTRMEAEALWADSFDDSPSEDVASPTSNENRHASRSRRDSVMNHQ